MDTPVKLGAYTLCLLAAFGAAAGIGTAVGPVGPAEVSHESRSRTEGHAAAGHGDADAPAEAMSTELPGGLTVSQDGYTFDPSAAVPPAGPATPLSFRVLGPGSSTSTRNSVTTAPGRYLSS